MALDDEQAIMREDESIKSCKLQTMKPCIKVRVLQFGSAVSNRVKVYDTENGISGWISILDKNTKSPLLGIPCSNVAA